MANGTKSSRRRDEAPKPAEVIDITPPLDPAVQQALQAYTEGDALDAVGRFVRGLQSFVIGAKELEDEAGKLQAQARNAVQPVDVASDEAIQRQIKAASALKTKITGYWSITSVFSQVHKRLVAGRTRGENMAEEARSTLQRLHNQYADAERRRVEDEARAEQKRLEEEAAQRRKLELQQMEEEALKAEAASPDLSDRERAFVRYFVERGGTATDTRESATSAGYADPLAQAARLMKSPKILAAIDAAKQAAAIRHQRDAVKAAPLDVDYGMAADLKPQTGRAGTDRTTYSAEVFDADALRKAVIAGQGIPFDVLTVDPAKVNAYARELREGINRWPGVRLVKKVTTV